MEPDAVNICCNAIGILLENACSGRRSLSSLSGRRARGGGRLRSRCGCGGGRRRSRCGCCSSSRRRSGSSSRRCSGSS
ncbi:unnamed protein product [Rotaria sp. Silwood2]|nr:unnamed protein product [Rotaria sp. Silwood2]